MEPVILTNNDNFPVPASPSSGPTLFLSGLRGVELPMEGEIRLRYSLRTKTERETRHDETCDYELAIKAITDICDCADKKDDGLSDPEPMRRDEDDTEAALDKIREGLTEDDLEEEED